ncbi:MAG: XRE family transcriptional regulator [Parvularculaceae bacterium]|nr:MAG: XRE family transcriptional regulator [Parvularculaceae bacterium]
MEPHDFRKWRRQLKLSQKEAANALGLKRRMIQYYEKGERDGEKVKIPLAVRLACYAISEGIADYHGPHRKPAYRDVEAPKDVDQKDGVQKAGGRKGGKD